MFKIDWEQLNRDTEARRAAWYASLPPEQKAEVDAKAERRARAEATEEPIVATFERIEYKKPAPVRPAVQRRPGMWTPQPKPVARPDGPRESEVVDTWEKTISLRIEEVVDHQGATREVIRFLGAVTGHEAYHLDADFCARLIDPEENRLRPRWYLCAGTAGRYDGCYVEPADIETYLRKHRPHLFPDHTP